MLLHALTWSMHSKGKYSVNPVESVPFKCHCDPVFNTGEAISRLPRSFHSPSLWGCFVCLGQTRNDILRLIAMTITAFTEYLPPKVSKTFPTLSGINARLPTGIAPAPDLIRGCLKILF